MKGAIVHVAVAWIGFAQKIGKLNKVENLSIVTTYCSLPLLAGRMLVKHGKAAETRQRSAASRLVQKR